MMETRKQVVVTDECTQEAGRVVLEHGLSRAHRPKPEQERLWRERPRAQARQDEP
jgi:hypothetical protein